MSKRCGLPNSKKIPGMDSTSNKKYLKQHCVALCFEQPKGFKPTLMLVSKKDSIVFVHNFSKNQDFLFCLKTNL